MGNEFVYDGVPGTHQWYDGTPHPWEFARVWHLEPSPGDPDTVYAGVEDAALFRSSDGGKSWHELSGLREHGTGPSWQPGAGGLCLHTILLDPGNPARIIVAISSAGSFRSDDAGETWRPINRGLVSEQIPDPTAEVQPYWAARADLLARRGEARAAGEAFERAIGLEPDPVIRRFLSRRRAEVAKG